jgi:hypothetical protein
MEERFLFFAGIVAAGAILLRVILSRMERKNAVAKDRVRRGMGHAMLGLQGFLEPSVEHIFQAQNVEQRKEQDDEAQGGGECEEAIRSSLAEAMSQSPIDTDEVRRYLTAAARTGLDWKALFAQAVADELTERPYRAPSIPPARRVAPLE